MILLSVTLTTQILSMASDNDKSSNNHNLDGSLKSNKKLANSGSIGKRLIVFIN